MAFDTVHNARERAVFDEVERRASTFPLVAADAGLRADAACVALNRLPARYIRHGADAAFYASDRERADETALVAAAVDEALHFVQARVALGARR